MTYTNLPNGLSSFGIPVFGGALPPFTGQYLFVNYATGNDGNTGTADNPLKTLAAAYALTTSGNNDVIFIVGNGTTTATQRLTATLTWANNATHLIGLTAPTPYASRARISNLTTAVAEINPMMTISGSGCIFANYSMFQGVGQAGTAEQLVTITGSRNHFSRVHFGGMGATASTGGAAATTSYSLSFGAGGDENFFQDCVVGLDTVQRTAANASVIFQAGAGVARNLFQNCIFPMDGLNANTPYFIDASGVGCLDRDTIFRNCYFYNTVNSTGTQLSVGSLAPVAGSPAGTLVFDNCTGVGFTKWTATSAFCYVTGPVTGAGTTAGIGATIA